MIREARCGSITGYGMLSGIKPKKSARTSRMIRKKAIITVLLRSIITLLE
jgi:hypothetical protein